LVHIGLQRKDQFYALDGSHLSTIFYFKSQYRNLMVEGRRLTVNFGTGMFDVRFKGNRGETIRKKIGAGGKG
jgi:hypothetical protein